GGGIAAIDQRVGQIGCRSVDHDCKTANIGPAGNAGPPNSGTEGVCSVQLGLDMLRALGRHGDRLPVDQFETALVLVLRPDEEFRHGHALDGDAVHGPQDIISFAMGRGSEPAANLSMLELIDAGHAYEARETMLRRPAPQRETRTSKR